MSKKWPKRFAEKVDTRGVDECWPWLGTIIPGGYGQFWYEGRMENAHRMALFFDGKNIDGKTVRHSCDNRPCCNPIHLFCGSQADNMADMVAKGRSLRGEKHHRAILTESDVFAIRLRKENAREAAIKYGVARCTINDIRQGKSWSHI